MIYLNGLKLVITESIILMNKIIKRTIIFSFVFIFLSSIFYFGYAKHKIRSDIALHAVHSFLKNTDDFKYIDYSWSGRDKVFGDRYTVGVKFIDEESTVYDFKYFHKTGSDKEVTIREIFDTAFYKYKDVYVFKFTANSYLRSQIRLMVGFLIAINDKKLTIEDLKAQLKLKKNIFKTPIIPNGLYLAKIKYSHLSRWLFYWNNIHIFIFHANFFPT